jgi:hypothetical protein
MNAISQQCEVEFSYLIKYLSEPPSYAAVTPIKEIPLGDIDGILQWNKFRASVAAGVNELVRRPAKQAEWDRTCAQMLKVLVELDVGAEATEKGEMSAWLTTYLSQRPPVDTLEEAATSEYPFVEADTGRVVLFGSGFRRWLYLTFQERVNPKELGRRLRAFGAEPGSVNITEGGKRSSRSIWRLPANFGGGTHGG